MKFVIRKDQKKRSSYADNEFERKILKAISQNLSYQNELRWKAQLQLSDLPKRSAKSQIHRRCILSGRGRFIIRGFSLSRFMIRKYAQEGSIPGVQKACW